MNGEDIEKIKLDLEKEKLIADTKFRKKELELLEIKERKGDWHNPLVIAAIGGVLGLASNVMIMWYNGTFQRDLEDRKAEAARILEVLKTGDADVAAENLQLLVDTKLVTYTAPGIEKYLAERQPGTGARLPTQFKFESSKIPPVHLRRNETDSITRFSTRGLAFSLNETDMPTRASTQSNERASELSHIIEWLDVENSKHLRYQNNHPNVYLYDIACLSDVYLPRVWWSSKAIESLASGTSQKIIYDKTIYEQNSKNLFNWFIDWGTDYGWSELRVNNFTQAQQFANVGMIVVVIAEKRDLNEPSHMSIIVPETKDHKALRDGDNVLVPIQSYVGRKNCKYCTSKWWDDGTFSDVRIWVHD